MHQRPDTTWTLQKGQFVQYRERMMSLVFSAIPLLALASPGENTEPWHHPLYLNGGGYWKARVPVTLDNHTGVRLEGSVRTVEIGEGEGQANLIGERAEAIRVCDRRGVEVLFGLYAPDAAALASGPIPRGAKLVIPVECKPRSTARYYVYFDNPSARMVPDYWDARPALANGDLERGAGNTPFAWQHDAGDETHRATWSSESPKSGDRCLKTVVAPGAEPTWIATRQRDIHVLGNTTYRMTGWVKAQDVKGRAGWYVHIGNGEQPMLLAPMLNGGDGTYDWKKVSTTFTTPAAADRVSLGTVLRGTGTAWFDLVRLEPVEQRSVKSLSVGPVQRRTLQQLVPSASWDPPGAVPDARWDRRLQLRVFNFDAEPMRDAIVSFRWPWLSDAGRERFARSMFLTGPDGAPVRKAGIFGQRVCFPVTLPPESAGTCHAYFSSKPDLAAGSPDGGCELVAAEQNLVDNPGFEQGDGMPSGWAPSGAADESSGVTFGLAPPGHRELGSATGRLHVPHSTAPRWRGWRQSVAVEPGGLYLYAAWVKCRDYRGKPLRLHAHCLTSTGELSNHQPFRGVGEGLEANHGWTLISGVLKIPADTKTLQLHLTAHGTGTIWHDGVVVAAITQAEVVGLEGRPMTSEDELKIWPVPAVAKVFPHDPAPATCASAQMAAARNEWEPLQLAIRSGVSLDGVQLEVEPPTGPRGARLERLDINLVGYVPIERATNYYRHQGPAWHRKVPTASPRCDGWPGLWPDPLLPNRPFDLAPNHTRAVWITVAVDDDTLAGTYRGTIRLTRGTDTLGELPLVVRVWDFSLPRTSHLKAIYDVRLGRGEAGWSRPLSEMYQPIVKFMADRRLCPDKIRPAPSIRYENGQVKADFAAFDRAAAWYFDELKLPHAYAPWQFYMFGWGHPPKSVQGEQPYAGEFPFDDADRSQLRPEFKRAYQACLRSFWDHLKQKGWEKKVILYISDEPFFRKEHIREQMKALCQMIHEVDPDIPIYSSTWHHVPEWDGALDVWGLGHYGVVPPEKLRDIREGGARVWFTTDGQMCMDTPYCAVERLLPHYCFHYNVEAYEFWGVAWLTNDPYRYGWHKYIRQAGEPGDSYWVRYPNGDGYLLYPGVETRSNPLAGADSASPAAGGPADQGFVPTRCAGFVSNDELVSSIRLEQAREGVEDYEYLRLLRQHINQRKATGANVSAAESVLERAADLVEIPNAGGRYSSQILPDPAAIHEVRRAIAKVLE